MHAAVSWCMRFPGKAARWHDFSNYLVILGVDNEETLLEYHSRLEHFRSMLVEEPDLDGARTAFAVEDRAWRQLSSLPLAMKEPAMV